MTRPDAIPPAVIRRIVERHLADFAKKGVWVFLSEDELITHGDDPVNRAFKREMRRLLKMYREEGK